MPSSYMYGPKLPSGPLDFRYGQGLCTGEGAAAAAIEMLLVESGKLLYDRYLQQKAFSFAADATVTAVQEHLRMCYVPHDLGEERFDEDWSLEQEPEPGAIDSWARMHVQVREVRKQNFPTLLSFKEENKSEPSPSVQKMKTSQSTDFGLGRRQASPPAEKKGARSSQKKQIPVPKESRSCAIVEHVTMEEEEEKLREGKRQEQVRIREKARREKDAEKNKEEERKKVVALHEEMDKRPHTFDSDGNIIWVELPHTEKLPKVQEDAPFNIKRRNINAALVDESAASKSASGVTDRRGRKSAMARERQSIRPDVGQDAEFTDGFSKLQHGQPPILDTMVLQTGVFLESMGKKKAGPSDYSSDRQMSRMEYVLFAERESAAGGSVEFGADARANRGQDLTGGGSSVLGGPPIVERSAAAAASKPATPQSRRSHTSAAPPALELLREQEREPSKLRPNIPDASPGNGRSQSQPAQQQDTVLPPIQRQPARSPAASNPGAAPGMPPPSQSPPTGGGTKKPIQMAPARPPPNPNAHFAALGFMRPPRSHMPSLGMHGGSRWDMRQPAAPPPVGATMGHGMIRSGSTGDDYFYFPPSNVSPQDLILPKVASEPSLSFQKRPSNGGRMMPQNAKAYENFRRALQPLAVA